MFKEIITALAEFITMGLVLIVLLLAVVAYHPV